MFYIYFMAGWSWVVKWRGDNSLRNENFKL